MGLQVRGEVDHGHVITSRGGEEQPLGLKVMHDGQVVLPAPLARVVDADDLHTAHVVERAGLLHVVLDAQPQLLVATPQHRGRLLDGQFPAQRQRQRLEQGGETRSLARPGHVHLARLAAACAGHARHVSMKPCLVLEEVQMPP